MVTRERLLVTTENCYLIVSGGDLLAPVCGVGNAKRHAATHFPVTGFLPCRAVEAQGCLLAKVGVAAPAEPVTIATTPVAAVSIGEPYGRNWQACTASRAGLLLLANLVGGGYASFPGALERHHPPAMPQQAWRVCCLLAVDPR